MALRTPHHAVGCGVALTIACGAGHAPGHGHGHPHGHGEPGGHRHDFSNVEHWRREFDAADRDTWQKPAEVVALLAVTEGAVVADLGAGTGYFLPHLARAVGPSGRVIGVDVEPNMVRHMLDRIAREGIANATAALASFDDALLGDASVDRILIVDTWHHLGDRVEYTRRLARALRPAGAVVIVDFTLESPNGPPAHARVSAEAASAELRAAGLVPTVLEESLPYQYVLRGALP